jgi:hypothetical protein
VAKGRAGASAMPAAASASVVRSASIAEGSTYHGTTAPTCAASTICRGVNASGIMCASDGLR